MVTHKNRCEQYLLKNGPSHINDVHKGVLLDYPTINVETIRRELGQNTPEKTGHLASFIRKSPGVYDLTPEKRKELSSDSSITIDEESPVMVDESLNGLFYEFAATYNTEDGPEREQSLSIMDKLITRIEQYTPSEYIVDKGVGGKGGWKYARIPWIGIRDPEFTSGFTEGIYIFYSRSEDKKFIYLSIGQGTSKLKDRFGSKAGTEQIISNVSVVQKILDNRIKEEKYLKKINLVSNADSAKDYENSVFLAKKYVVSKLPSDEVFIDDLKKIIKIYPEVTDTLTDALADIAEELKPKTKKKESELDEKVEKTLEEYLESKDEYDEKTLEALDNIGNTDSAGSKSNSWRREQVYLRKILFSDRKEARCGLCNQIRPTKNIMIAGHIKPRAACSYKERTDPNIVMPICKIGCDDLFEKGYLLVNSDGFIEVNQDKFITEELNSFMKQFEGKKCKSFNKDTKKYFAYKYNQETKT